MIDRAEIMELAGKLSLRPEIVEKDYVLGWLLAGIGEHPDLRNTWVFWGGTCLKKIHFETYRFSEDLDFTPSESAQVDEAFLLRAFGQIAGYVYDSYGIEILQDQTRFEVYTNQHGGRNAEGRVYYRGPLLPTGSPPRIKLDITADEVIVLEPEQLPVAHPYTDDPTGGIMVLSYPFAEVFAEKIGALAKRGRPRDPYEVINLFRREEGRAAQKELRACLEEKCLFKGIPVPELPAIEANRSELEADWDAMLAPQLPVLPPYPMGSGERPVYLGRAGTWTAEFGSGSLERSAGQRWMARCDLTRIRMVALAPDEDEREDDADEEEQQHQMPGSHQHGRESEEGGDRLHAPYSGTDLSHSSTHGYIRRR